MHPTIRHCRSASEGSEETKSSTPPTSPRAAQDMAPVFPDNQQLTLAKTIATERLARIELLRNQMLQETTSSNTPIQALQIAPERPRDTPIAVPGMMNVAGQVHYGIVTGLRDGVRDAVSILR